MSSTAGRHAPAGAGLRAWMAQPANLLLLVLTALLLAPIWSFRYFPSQDGPEHIYDATVLRDYHASGADILREYFAISPQPVTKWFAVGAMALLGEVVPPPVAEKLLLSFYIILWVWAVRYALGAFGAKASDGVFLTLPFIYNFPLHMGFYDYAFSLAFMFFVLGFWLRREGRLTWRQVPGWMALLLTLYFCHVVTLALTLGAVALLAIVWFIADWTRHKSGDLSGRDQLKRIAIERLVAPALAAAPAVGLMIYFMTLSVPTGGGWGLPSLAECAQKLQRFLTLYHAFVAYQRSEILFSFILAIALTFAALAMLAIKLWLRRWSRCDGLLAVAAVWFLIYMAAPQAVGEGYYLFHRLTPLPYLALSLWLAAQARPRVLRFGLNTVVICIAIILAGLNSKKYAQIDGYLDEYLSCSQLIPANSTLLALHFATRTPGADGEAISYRVDPFIHAAGHLAAGRHIVLLSDYEASLGVFPVRFRPEVLPSAFTGYLDDPQPKTRQARDFFLQSAGRSLDYVMLWDDRSQVDQSPGMQPVRKWLGSEYHLVFQSAPRGWMRLYQRNQTEGEHP